MANEIIYSVGDPSVSTTAALGTNVETPFEYKTHVFPSDLNLDINEQGAGGPVSGVTTDTAVHSSAHYMIIYANVQRRTQFPYTASSVTNLSQRAQNSILSGGDLSSVDKLLSTINNTYRTNEAFVFHVPDTMLFTNSQTYDTFNLGGTFFAAALSGAQSIQEYARQNKGRSDYSSPQARNLVSGLAGIGLGYAASQFGGTQGRNYFSALTGYSFNPFMEVIYTKPNFRTFRFEYSFYPRNSSDASQLVQLITRLRYHSSPEVKGFFLVPPSTFDIKFFFKGSENSKVDKISTCVLRNIDVDYAPNGWSTFSDGMPVAIRLSLQFEETEYLTKASYSGGATAGGGSAGISPGVAAGLETGLPSSGISSGVAAGLETGLPTPLPPSPF